MYDMNEIRLAQVEKYIIARIVQYTFLVVFDLDNYTLIHYK